MLGGRRVKVYVLVMGLIGKNKGVWVVVMDGQLMMIVRVRVNVCLLGSQLLLLRGRSPTRVTLSDFTFLPQVLSLCLSSSRGGFRLGQTPPCSCVCLHILF